MKVVYCDYEPNKGLEEIQAQIYNTATKGSGELQVTAEKILQRYEEEEPDPKGIKYALKEDGTPLAYIQTRISTGPDRWWIGYPWTMPDCAIEVQETHFSKVYTYIKE